MISVFNIEQLNKLLQSFYTVSQIRITVFDDKFNEITAYPPNVPGFCACIRQHTEGLTSCRTSDRKACQAVKYRHSPYIFQCPAGLMEAIYPIEMNHIIIGYMFLGNLAAYEDEDEGWKTVKEKCKKYSYLNLSYLETEYKKLHYFSRDYIEASAQIMETIASYLCTRRMASLKYDTLAVQIDLYITEHLSEEISIETICDHFNISRTNLYQIADEVYGVGISTHIRNARIENAKKLLIDTDLPIRSISLECGIKDYNYFSKMFKRCTGYTPREYKKFYSSSFTE